MDKDPLGDAGLGPVDTLANRCGGPSGAGIAHGFHMECGSVRRGDPTHCSDPPREWHHRRAADSIGARMTDQQKPERWGFSTDGEKAAEGRTLRPLILPGRCAAARGPFGKLNDT